MLIWPTGMDHGCCWKAFSYLSREQVNSAPNPSTKSAATSLSRPSPVRSWGQNGVSSLLSQDVSSPLLLLPSPAQCVPIQFLKHVILCQNLDKLACVAVCNLDAVKRTLLVAGVVCVHACMPTWHCTGHD